MIPGGTHCRFCDAPLELTVVDLGKSPLCESFLPADQARGDGAVLSRSTCASATAAGSPSCHRSSRRTRSSPSTRTSPRTRTRGSSMRGLRRDDQRPPRARRSDSLVVELASNDGYLLQHFLPGGIPVLGIDPAANVALAAEERGVPTLVEFFGVEAGGAARRRGAAGRSRDRETTCSHRSRI